MAQNPDPRDAQIAKLEALLRVAIARIDALETEVRELRAKLAENSKNSSKPPSSDGPSTTRQPGKATGRKRGGQRGHEGHERVMLPPDTVVDHRPIACRACAAPLAGDDAEPARVQVLELPEIKPNVTEHRGHSLRCRRCGAVTTEPIPADIQLHGFGPRVAGLVAYLSGRCRLSKRQISETLDDVFSFPMSVGSVCAVEQDVSAALAGPVAEAEALVRRQAVVHMDETGWREDKQLAWLWVAVTSVATVFKIARSRGSSVARGILGADFAGILVTDRWSAYGWVASRRRQLCWSHLLRDLQGMADRGGVGAQFGQMMLDDAGKMFEWWARVKDGALARRTFQQRMNPVRARFGERLRDAHSFAERKTAGMCREILALEPALWTFIDVVGVEPTNNVGERAIRHAVLWRKGSFGTDSANGSRFVERILTTVATLRQQKRSVLGYLALACASYRSTRASPSLLPAAAAR